MKQQALKLVLAFLFLITNQVKSGKDRLGDNLLIVCILAPAQINDAVRLQACEQLKKILQLPQNSNMQQIQHAFRCFALRFHPDKNPETAKLFQYVVALRDVALAPIELRVSPKTIVFPPALRRDDSCKTCKRVTFADNFGIPALKMTFAEIMQLPEDEADKLVDQLLEEHCRKHDPEYYLWQPRKMPCKKPYRTKKL